jgi:hypothetical protein
LQTFEGMADHTDVRSTYRRSPTRTIRTAEGTLQVDPPMVAPNLNPAAARVLARIIQMAVARARQDIPVEEDGS